MVRYLVVVVAPQMKCGQIVRGEQHSKGVLLKFYLTTASSLACTLLPKPLRRSIEAVVKEI